MTWKNAGFSLLILAAGVATTFTSACSEGGGSATTGGTTGGSTGSTSSGGTGVPEGCAETGANVIAPTTEAALKEGGAPDLSCYTTPASLGASQNVTVTGCLDIFGVGSRAKAGLRLSVYGIDQNPGPNQDTPRYGDVAIELVDASECEFEGKYTISNIPTNTPLIYKTYEQAAAGAQKQAVDTYHYNVVIRADRHDTDNDGTYEYAANMIYASTYATIPPLAGRTVEGGNNLNDLKGRGVIAGEVRDCQGEGRSVMNATVGGSCIDTPTAKVVYFDGAEDPKPAIQRTSTNNDGLFAMLNVYAVTNETAGRKQELEGKVLAGGQVISAGKVSAYIYPDSVTIFSPQGLLPTQ
ncbi:MAG: hypothetical protein AB2A00_37910 [Myxococcota bacterium]